MRNTVFIFDIDSTLADNTHRVGELHRVCSVCLGSYNPPVPARERQGDCSTCQTITRTKFTQESWDSFLHPEAIMRDTVYPAALSTLQKLRRGGSPILYLTGRQNCLREVTEQWLDNNVERLPEEKVIMRGLNDRRPASKVKEELFLAHVAPCYPDATFIFFEDDPHVIPVYSSYGIVVKCPDVWELDIITDSPRPPNSHEAARDV